MTLNDDFVLNLPNDMGNMEKKIVDDLSVKFIKSKSNRGGDKGSTYLREMGPRAKI